MTVPCALIQILSDGEVHSVDKLCASLKLDPLTLFGEVQKINLAGLVVEVLGNNYKLLHKLDLLSSHIIKKYFIEHLGADCDVVCEIDSTSSAMLEIIKQENKPSGYCIIAEAQMAGRGRRGKSWASPFAQNIYFSFIWRFEGGVSTMEGLSLVVGLSVVQVLRAMNVSDVSLKWPNDVLITGKKMAGILIEAATYNNAPCNAIIGIGLNVYMNKCKEVVIDQLWTSLDRETELELNRTDIFLKLVEKIYKNVTAFKHFGFSPFINEWNNFDGYLYKDIMILAGDNVYFGVSQGVTNSGELLVKTKDGLKTFVSGEVSLRLSCDIGN